MANWRAATTAGKLGQLGRGAATVAKSGTKGSGWWLAADALNRTGEFKDDGSDPYMERSHFDRITGGKGTKIEKAGDKTSGFWGALGGAYEDRGAFGVLGNLWDGSSEFLAAHAYGAARNADKFLTGKGEYTNAFADDNWILDKQGKIQFNPRGWAPAQGSNGLSKSMAEQANTAQALGQIKLDGPGEREAVLGALGEGGEMSPSFANLQELRKGGSDTSSEDNKLLDSAYLRDGEIIVPGVGIIRGNAAGDQSNPDSPNLTQAINYMHAKRGGEASGYESPEMQFERHEARRLEQQAAGVPQSTHPSSASALGRGGSYNAANGESDMFYRGGGGSAGERVRAQAMRDMTKLERLRYNTTGPGMTRDSGKLQAWNAINSRIERRAKAADRSESEQLARASEERVAQYEAAGYAARGSRGGQYADGPTSAQAGMANTAIRQIYEMFEADELEPAQIAKKVGFRSVAEMYEYIAAHREGRVGGSSQQAPAQAPALGRGATAMY